ncbi:hypothetical protein [Pseudomonas sp. PLMAX]|uniref:flagellar biosynthesis protein FlhF n=1 Tax=Pseudomonas sp. PLMAX TaxID=2201998 RepID=UPI0038BA948D
MTTKRFEAPTAREAMILVRKEFGDDDFLIYKNVKIAGGVEIIAGPYSSVPVQKAKEPEPEPVLTGFKSALSNAGQHLDPFEVPSLPTSKLKAASAAYRQAKGGVAYAKQAADVPTPEKVIQPAAPKEATPRVAQATPEQVIEVFEAEVVEDEPEVPPQAQADAAQKFQEDLKNISAVADWSKHLLGDVVKMQEVIRRRLLPRVAEGSSYADLHKLLTTAGFKPAMSEAILKHLPSEIAERRLDPMAMSRWVEQALIAQIKVMPDPELWWGGRAVIPVVGSSGAGKTTSVAKLAARFVMNNEPSALTVVSLDPDHSDTLKVFAEVLGVEFKVLQEYQDLGELLGKLRHKSLVLIDTPGFGYKSKKLPGLLSRLAIGDQPMKPVMVMNANAESQLLDMTAKTYLKHGEEAGLKIAHCVITKLDDTVSIGGLLSVIDKSSMAVTYQSESSDILDDFERGSAMALAQQAFEAIPEDGTESIQGYSYQDGKKFDGYRDELLKNVHEMSQMLSGIKRELKSAGFNSSQAEISGLVESKSHPQFGLQVVPAKEKQQDKPALLWFKNDYPVESMSYKASSLAPVSQDKRLADTDAIQMVG